MQRADIVFGRINGGSLKQQQRFQAAFLLGFVWFRTAVVVFQAAFTGLAAPKLCFQTASSGFCRVCAAGTHAVAGVRAGAGGAVRAWYPRAWQSHTPYAAWLGSLKGFSDGLLVFQTAFRVFRLPDGGGFHHKRQAAVIGRKD